MSDQATRVRQVIDALYWVNLETGELVEAVSNEEFEAIASQRQPNTTPLATMADLAAAHRTIDDLRAEIALLRSTEAARLTAARQKRDGE